MKSLSSEVWNHNNNLVQTEKFQAIDWHSTIHRQEVPNKPAASMEKAEETKNEKKKN